MSYGSYKNYGRTPQQVYNSMTSDRQAVFDASVRALFQEIEDDSGNTTGKRVIDFLDEVRGIWGVRYQESHGDRMFRLSVRWKPGIAKALGNSGNLGKSSFAHVLLPEPTGGDDDQTFTKFNPSKDSLETFRQSGGHPSIQVSLIKNDETTGEVDIDFEPWWDSCHKKPSNSDVGSVAGSHVHTSLFNARYPFFQRPLQLSWSSAKHCQDVY